MGSRRGEKSSLGPQKLIRGVHFRSMDANALNPKEIGRAIYPFAFVSLINLYVVVSLLSA
jgi:hypothetical protein